MKLIDIKNLTFEYFRRDEDGNVDEAVEALSDITMDVKAGDFIAILGRNGCGKSTLAKHINALLLPETGEVIVDGMDIENEELRLSIRKTAGMVFQNPDNQIVGNMVEEDVAFGPENIGVPTRDIWNRVDWSLDAVGMSKLRKALPNHLSGGQKQRVAIAGVLAMEPKCIIFDEATAMLDPAGRKKIVEIAKYLKEEKGITIIFITHHMDEVLDADKVIVMDQGRIVLMGTPEEIFEEKEQLAEYGLELPVYRQYLKKIIDLNIVTKDEVQDAGDENRLAYILMNKYMEGIDYINNIDDRDITMMTERDFDGKSIGILSKNTSDESNTFPYVNIKQGIFLNNVSYVYNKGFAEECIALKNVNLSIEKGEFIGIIGHTGSGKSTLLQHFNGLMVPTLGEVFFDGQDIRDEDFDLKKLRQKVSLVFQYPESQLFAETVEKDVCFGPKNMNISSVEAQKRAYEAIAMVGLPDTIYDYSPFQLSGGQQRRVAIAGALAMQPEFLVLDEPTAGLDPQSAREIMQMLKRLQTDKGIGIVVVSHSMEEVAEYADRIVVLNHGKVKYDGTVYNVFSMEDELNSMGLELPVGIKILRRLKQVGFDVNIKKYRSSEICEEIRRITIGQATEIG